MLLEHENGIPLDPSLKRLFPNSTTHDPSNLSAARDFASDDNAIPIGLLDWGLRLAESMGGVNVTRFRNLIFSGLNGGELLNVDSEESNERVIITME